MRVLQLFSNSKWTGPAEPVLNLCVSLRDKGLEVDFACAPQTGSKFNKIVAVAREHGLLPLDFMYLSKHRHPVRNFFDVYALRRRLTTVSYDLIHCNLDNDHRIALSASRGLGIPVVRSNHFGAGFPSDRRHRRLIARSAMIIEPSHMALEDDCAAFAVPRERLAVVPGAIDTVRFDGSRSLPDLRKQLGIPAGAFVVGIVARMQPHRHYEDLFEAFHLFLDTAENAHLVVVGRGTRQEQVGFAPVRRLKLTDRVHFTGYIDGDDYVGMLAGFDVGIFLTPGTDGGCRAAREIMAMGKAMVVADRGMLREIVAHNSEGFVTDGSVEQLRDALTTLYRQPQLRRQFAANAHAKAHTRYTLTHQADAVIDVYETICAYASM